MTPNLFLSIFMLFVYLANTAVLCYSLTIICCCQVQNYIYWIISTENKIWKTIEKRRQHASAYLSSKIFATSSWVWTCSTSFCSFQRSNWPPTDIMHLFHLEDTALLFHFLSESVKVRFLPRVHTFFCPRTTCCLLFLNSAHAQDGFL